MKHPISSLRHANQTYHSMQQTARALLQRAEIPLLVAALFYKAATQLVFVPAMQQLWALTLHFTPMHYLSNHNASDIFSSPFIICCIVLIAILTAFWTLYEFSVLLHGLDMARNGQKIRLTVLFCNAFLDIRHAFLPQNWPVFLYCAVMIPFTNLFLTSNYITQLAVPEYILDFIQKNQAYHLLYLTIVALLWLICIGWILVLPLFILERCSLRQAVHESISYVKKRFFRLTLLLARWNLSVMLRASLRFFILLLALFLGIAAVGLYNNDAMLALLHSVQLIEEPFLSYLLDCVATIAQCSILAMLYYRLRENAPPELAPRPDGKRYRSGGRLFFAAILTGSVLLTGIVALFAYVTPENGDLRALLGVDTPLITAHRGYSAAAPENTLPAFQAAIDHHCNRAELDVQMTRDGVVMVTHDSNLRRCTGLDAQIYDLTYDEVRSLDAGRWYSPRFAGTKIPTLEEVLQLCKNRIELNIEIKPDASTPDLEAETVRLIQKYGFEQECVITSQSYESLRKVKELDPQISTGYILALGVGSYYDLPAADFFSVEATFINSAMVQQIHLRGKTVSAWTINRESDAETLLDLGVDDLITDKPEMVQQVLASSDAQDSAILELQDALASFLHLKDPADAESAQEVFEDAVEDPDEVLDAA